LLDLEPLKVSELLARWQPRAGWGGDLTVTGQLKASHRSGVGWTVDAQLARREGDLSLADSSIEGGGEQRFGLRQISLDLKARDGVWTARQSIEGRVIGALRGQQIVQARDAEALPAASDPLQGELSIQMSNLRPLGAWAPAGWRLAGQLSAQARLTGVLGAPQYSGTVTGQKLGASHALLGVSLSEGDLLLTLQGDQARLDRLVARGGGEGSAGGRIELTGEALLGAQPTATLTLKAERFGLLSRIDRRAVVSGDAQLALGAETLKVDGRLKVDEGLVDLSRDDAPTVGDDVNVLNRPGELPEDETPAAPVSRRKWQVQLALDLGSALRLKGRGIDTRLSGGLRLSTPGGRPQVQGTISTSDGTYIAYGQKLVIERGTLAFTGPTDNPRLDIQAMRAQSPLAAS
ncbi:MAG TPA: translocation/assembly module TamB domain-containing protein, partial [Aquabacterium sp.]|nr:translocation/assembly module TamB domain-containing protein [Aquabacterium sp.]